MKKGFVLQQASSSRSASLTGFVEAIEELGLDPFRLADEAGLPAEALSNPDLRISNSAVADILELALVRSGAADLGLRIAGKRPAWHWGPLGLIVRNQPTLGHVVRTIADRFGIQNDGVRMDVIENGPSVELRLWVVGIPQPISAHVSDMMVATLHRNLRQMLGAGWSPQAVCFRHAAPNDDAPYLKAFELTPNFDQEFDGLLIASSDLALEIAGADAELLRAALNLVSAADGAESKPIARVVEDVMRVLLSRGQLSAAAVAQSLGMSTRSLQRSLAADATSFEAILDSVRLELAKNYVEGSSRPLAEVSDMLGFSNQSAFSRWHKIHRGDTPMARRKANGAAAWSRDANE